MALKIDFKDKSGNTGDYVNIDVNLGEKIGNIIKATILLNFWKDQETRTTAGAIPYNEKLLGSRTERIVGFDTIVEFDYDLEAEGNLYEQAYTYLKTLPAFTKEDNVAVDVI
jgi:hypothetical protein